MEEGFIKADSSNLPKIDAMMVGDFFKSSPDFCSAEFRNVKTSASSRQSYGDDAIGYVQLKKVSGLCTVKCRICPEHKVTTKSYSVTMVVNEMEGSVEKIECHDCTASEGCCKHAIAFLMWVHRRSEEPSCTSVECYWKKSKLSKVGRSLKFTTAKELSKSRPTLKPTSLQTSVLEKFLEEGNKRRLECQILKHQPSYDHHSYSLHQLTIQLKGCKDAEEFLCRTSAMYDVKKIRQMELETRDQNESNLWHELRYGRITASKAYDVSRCKTEDGCLVAAIMGAKLPNTPAMIRGRMLEDSVRKEVERVLGEPIKKCGIFLTAEATYFAASPDGLTKEAIVEIKCPTSKNTFKNYIKSNGEIFPKYFAQLQMQMFATHLTKGYFCVADPDFEKTNTVTITEVKYNDIYVRDILQKIEEFWQKYIFPLLVRNTAL